MGAKNKLLRHLCLLAFFLVPAPNGMGFFTPAAHVYEVANDERRVFEFSSPHIKIGNLKILLFQLCPEKREDLLQRTDKIRTGDGDHFSACSIPTCSPVPSKYGPLAITAKRLDGASVRLALPLNLGIRTSHSPDFAGDA